VLASMGIPSHKGLLLKEKCNFNKVEVEKTMEISNKKEEIKNTFS